MENMKEGLTRREWYAGLVLQKIIEAFPSRKPDDCAVSSIVYADAMISALEDKEETK